MACVANARILVLDHRPILSYCKKNTAGVRFDWFVENISRKLSLSTPYKPPNHLTYAKDNSKSSCVTCNK